MTLSDITKQIYIWSTGYSYTHLGRLFLRMFVGVMLLQFGVRQWMNFDMTLVSFPELPFMESTTGLVLLIIAEIFCSFCIMIGFCTRLMTIPPFIAMAVAEWYLLSSAPEASYMLSWETPAYLPVMFMGIYFFILLVGPGKISCDYFLSLHIIHNEDKSEAELEEV